MLDIFIDYGAGPRLYNNYVESGIQIEDALNVPTLIKFTVANNDNNFVIPVRNSYVTIISRKLDKILGTGFVTQTPQARYAGAANNVPDFKNRRYHYDLLITSDEWLLNLKSTPFIPAFVNQTMGSILASLANTLLPNYFDTTSYVTAGDRIPYYLYDPTQKWSQIAKTFADSARFRYKVMNKQVYFQQYGDAPLGISYDDTVAQNGLFDPTTLDTSPLELPIINDLTIIGQVEPKAIRDDYFIGDGATGKFPLRHKAFRGSAALMLKEDWTSPQFATNVWTVFDPQGAMHLTGALNIIGGTGNLGQEYILGVNGLELGGALNLQHGEVQFNDTCTGIIGGLFNDVALQYVNCEVGFDISPSVSVTVTASGAGGIQVQPILNGVKVGTKVVTVPNHHYQLQTLISSNNYARFNRTFRSLGGSVYGGNSIDSLSTITWLVTDIDQATFNTPISKLIPVAPGVITRYTATASLPSFMVYAPVNFQQFNLTMNFTSISQPPQGTLVVQSLLGPTGAQLPVVTPGVPLQYLLGFGFENNTATILQQGDSDELDFYQDQIPAVGARIHLQTWEAGFSLARVTVAASIATEALTQGDDGVRGALINNLNPLPRTSDECEFAAQAILFDRTSQQYNGSYVCFDLFWDRKGADYPRTGRFFLVNSPERNISNAQFLIRKVTTRVIELYQEVLSFALEFGQDSYIDKFLRQFIQPTQPPLLPSDTATPLLPQDFANIGTTYLKDLAAANITGITAGAVTVDLGAPPITGCEVRRVDSGWGMNNQNRILLTGQQVFTLPRSSIDQTYYLRQLNNGKFSRNPKILRVFHPLNPASPLLVAVDNITDSLHPVVTIGLNGDIRNIRGTEIRAADNATVLFQRTFLTLADLIFTMDNTVSPQRGLTYYVYFFNLRFEYSPQLVVQINTAVPPAPVVSALANSDISATAVNIYVDTLPTRPDIRSVTIQVDDASTFNSVNLQTYVGAGNHGTFSLRTINALNKFIRAKRTDAFGDSAWSNVINTNAALMQASNFLNAQLSVLPLTSSMLVGLFTYTAVGHLLAGNPVVDVTWSWSAFSIKLPTYIDPTNTSLGQLQINMPAGSTTVANIPYTGLPTLFKFYPYLSGAYAYLTSNAVPTVNVVLSSTHAGNDVTGTGDDPDALSVARADGNLPLSVTSMVAAAPAQGDTGSGSDGGTG